ncbi:MAG: bifunctional phosphopantothenoylcysteine decarboxylase/phosphopantothenate--cysteine ligase CoaBC [Arsenophonus sp.]|nr:MAG: bifunctional phosphopantothenoylcysteine decarboxylase/phosphopantothenate--cysteine ligase CoaBC [Arsenophonus sp.]
MKKIAGKHILIGISGSIAAYKVPEIIRKLKKKGAIIRVVMTHSAYSFITPLTAEVISGHPIEKNNFISGSNININHIKLGKWADLILIIPATANLIARLSIGMANDLLTEICLVSKSRIAVVPAMNKIMYQSKFTQKNIKILKKRNFLIWGPEVGKQICNDFGLGKMLDAKKIIKLIELFFKKKKDMQNISITITAGPTYELLDPMRLITNYSSGKMGFSIAQAASERGAQVTLISGPVYLKTPKNVKRINVINALEMYKKVHQIIQKQNIFIGCAAVADYRPTKFSKQKIKTNNKIVHLKLIKNPDIIASVGKLNKNRPYVVGFSAETHNLIQCSHEKRIKKKLDLICANRITLSKDKSNIKNNSLNLLWKNKKIYLPFNNKLKLSHQLLDEIIQDYEKKYKCKNSR